MKIELPTDWPRTEAEALAEQDRLRPRVRTSGLDVGYAEDSVFLVGAVVVLDTAGALVLSLTTRYRLPETTRAADHLARMMLAEHHPGR